MIFGNLVIDDQANCVTLTVSTIIEGRADCVFTYDEIGQLASLLQTLASRKPKLLKKTVTFDDDLLG